MGRVLVAVTVSNIEDEQRAEAGEIATADVRSIVVDCLVDTGATFLCMPASLVEKLGLRFDRARETRTLTGLITLNVYRGARIEVQGRACTDEVMEIPEGRQPLLGQIPLEKLDWWIDVTNHKLVGNPEHGGHWMAEAY